MPERNRSSSSSKGGQASSQVQERDEQGQFNGRSRSSSDASSQRGDQSSSPRDDEGKYTEKK
jgi:hypothetical protein